MGRAILDVRHMREVAATFRGFAAQTDDASYIAKLIKTALELEHAADSAERESDGAESVRGPGLLVDTLC